MRLYGFSADKAYPLVSLRAQLLSQASRSALRFAIGMAGFAGSAVFFSPQAQAACTVTLGTDVQCGTTSTTNTTHPTSPPSDRSYSFASPFTAHLAIDAGATVSGFGLAIENTGNGAVMVVNNGTISVDAGNTPTAGGTAALNIDAASNLITYTGSGAITNNGSGDAFAIKQNGLGSIDVDATGDITAAAGSGIVVRNTAASGSIDVTTGAVTALAAGMFGIDVQSSSTAGNLTIVANGDMKAGNTGILGRVSSTGTGNIDITANGAIDAGNGIIAQNLGNGSTTVKAMGPVTATMASGLGVFAQGRGDVSITTGAVTSTGGQAVYAIGTGTGTGTIDVTTNGNVSGTGGILAGNSGTGMISVIANGEVTGTSFDGIVANGGGAVDVQVAGTVMGARSGLTLIGGGGGTGNLSVTGAGGFVGGSDDAVNIQNYGPGTVTVDISGASSSTSGGGIVVRDTATGGNIGVTTGAVTALAAGKIGIDVEMLSATANVTIVANGDVKAGGPGIFAGLSSGSGNVDVTANGAIDASSGIVAGTVGTGSVTVKAVGPITATTGRGIDAESSAGNVAVITGAVNATAATAIFALQDNPVGAGTINVTTNGNVSGTTGIQATNLGTGAITVIANGAVTGTSAEGIVATGNGVVDVQVAGTVTGATRGLTLTGGTGAINVASSGAIRSLSGLSSDAAIETNAATMALTNAGSIVGTAQFAGGATLFANDGNWNGAGGTSDFGGGASRLVNDGTAVGGNSAGVAETTQWTNLFQFTNQGTLTMADAGAGDVIRQTGGNTAFATGSIMAIDINTAGQADRFSTSGTATITGATLTVNAAGGIAVPGTRYTVLTADAGLTGQFAALTGVVNTAFLRLVDTYDTNNAYLDILKYRNFTDAALTRNQIATAGGLESLPTSGSLYNVILNLATDVQARDAFDQLSGEVYPSAQTSLIEDSRLLRDAATNRIRAAFGIVGASAAPVMAYADQTYGGAAGAYVSLDPNTTAAVASDTDRFALWSQGFGSWGHTGSDGNAARVDRSTGGFLAGGDAAIFDTWRLGIMAGYSRTNLDVKDRASSGSSDNYHLGLYGGTTWDVGGGTLGLRTGTSYTWHDIATSRSVTFPGFNDSLKADYRAGTAQVFGELGYGIHAGNLGFEPFANLAYVNLRTDGFTETGGAATLTSASAITDATFTTLGLHASGEFTVGEMAATVRGTLGWRHAFGEAVPLSRFAFAGGAPFTVAGVPVAKDGLILDVGFDIAIAHNATLGLTYGGQFGSRAADQSVKANLAVRF
ncbi:outer membrane autotransporter barrel domain protein [Mesorhizobium ciceri biovar biserrulae WSM1271]|uniref:Outer membrane autotransporter barrel domain protein n=2 Tax=Mesorhizobium ciceri TaxID=39645 RepID=E8T8S6_MESCW|nr:outer membrane autotransporter barrel domain protein [Mesorhizobium ciceri biovar biserrulae WSM1271]